jgi:hypothetical protein
VKLKILPPTGSTTENGISNGKFYFPFVVLLEVECHFVKICCVLEYSALQKTSVGLQVRQIICILIL